MVYVLDSHHIYTRIIPTRRHKYTLAHVGSTQRLAALRPTPLKCALNPSMTSLSSNDAAQLLSRYVTKHGSYA